RLHRHGRSGERRMKCSRYLLCVPLLGCGSPAGGGPTSAGTSYGESGDSVTTSSGDGETDTGMTTEGMSEGGAAGSPACSPETRRCSADQEDVEVCAATGSEGVLDPCGEYASCKSCIGSDDDPLCVGLAARCTGPCDSTDKIPSSEGCSFVAS